MTKKRDLQLAAGMVLLRTIDDVTQVAVVHRPLYDDWTLPKGKPEADEPLPMTAHREVLEETGYRAMLGAPVGYSTHEVAGRPKRTSWWIGYLVDGVQAPLEAEVDRVDWLSVSHARKRLTYDDDIEIMTEAVRMPSTLPFVVVRHTKAMSRKNWTGPDADRRLTERGRRQAKRLADLLEAYGVSQLASSSSTRCMDTLEPYAKRMGLPIEALDALSEEGAEAKPKAVKPAMNALRIKALESNQRLAICGHRPVLPSMADALNVDYEPMRPGDVLIAHLDRKGKSRGVERIPPRF